MFTATSEPASSHVHSDITACIKSCSQQHHSLHQVMFTVASSHIHSNIYACIKPHSHKHQSLHQATSRLKWLLPTWASHNTKLKTNICECCCLCKYLWMTLVAAIEMNKAYRHFRITLSRWTTFCTLRHVKCALIGQLYSIINWL